MSEKDAEINEVSTTAIEEIAPVVEGGQLQDACADLAPVTKSLGIQTPPLKGPETSALTDSLTTDSGYAEAASHPGTEEGEDQRGALPRCARYCPLLSSSQLDLPPAQNGL